VLQERKEETVSSVMYIKAHFQSSHIIFISNAAPYKPYSATSKYVSALCYVSVYEEMLMSFCEMEL